MMTKSSNENSYDPGSNPGKAIKKMRRLFKFRYPKLTFLVICIILTYIIFKMPRVNSFFSGLGEMSYIGIFIAGLLFSFGFTTPIAIGVFIASNPENIFLAALIGAIGSLISDLFIFGAIKFSFKNEFDELEKNKEIRFVENQITHIPKKIKHYLAYVFAGIIIATPLPDEIGVSMLSGFSHIKARALSILSLTLHFIGIIPLLLI